MPNTKRELGEAALESNRTNLAMNDMHVRMTQYEDLSNGMEAQIQQLGAHQGDSNDPANALVTRLDSAMRQMQNSEENTSQETE